MEKVFNKKIKILVIMPTLNKAGGIENSYMNYYKNFSDNFSFDFIVHDNDSKEYRDLIKTKKDKLYIFPKLNLKNIIEFKKNIKDFFDKNNDYDIIHCHMANGAYYYFKEAKKHNIKIRILHGHLTKYADIFSHSIRNYFLVKLGKKYTTDYMACGDAAGKFLARKEKFTIMNNAISLNKFEYNKAYRKEIRDKYEISDTDVLIGTVGRLAPVKNQKFLIDIIKKLNTMNNLYRLMIIGSGPLEKELKEYASKLKISDKIIFISSTNEVYKFYQAFDIFTLPSFSEGLPVVGIESQVSGLKVIVSDSITREIDLTNNIFYLPINNLDLWCNRIIELSNYKRENNIDQFKDSIYNLNSEVKKMENYYLKLIQKKELL